VRRSKPGSSGVMRARYICVFCVLHSGHCGRALIGAFSRVYSANVICGPSTLKAGATELSVTDAQCMNAADDGAGYD
jgi:hypothetical protein